MSFFHSDGRAGAGAAVPVAGGGAGASALMTALLTVVNGAQDAHGYVAWVGWGVRLNHAWATTRTRIMTTPTPMISDRNSSATTTITSVRVRKKPARTKGHSMWTPAR